MKLVYYKLLFDKFEMHYDSNIKTEFETFVSERKEDWLLNGKEISDDFWVQAIKERCNKQILYLLVNEKEKTILSVDKEEFDASYYLWLYEYGEIEPKERLKRELDQLSIQLMNSIGLSIDFDREICEPQKAMYPSLELAVCSMIYEHFNENSDKGVIPESVLTEMNESENSLIYLYKHVAKDIKDDINKRIYGIY